MKVDSTDTAYNSMHSSFGHPGTAAEGREEISKEKGESPYWSWVQAQGAVQDAVSKSDSWVALGGIFMTASSLSPNDDSESGTLELKSGTSPVAEWVTLGLR